MGAKFIQLVPATTIQPVAAAATAEAEIRSKQHEGSYTNGRSLAADVPDWKPLVFAIVVMSACVWWLSMAVW